MKLFASFARRDACVARAASSSARFARSLARSTPFVVAVACAALAPGCNGDPEEEYLLGPDQDGDGWPFELDCNDRDETVFPSADDIPGDGIDQDCSGSDAEGGEGLGGAGGAGAGGTGASASGGSEDGTGGKGAGTGGGGEVRTDADGDGFSPAPDGEDCDDTRPEVNPDAVELVLNGIDENCDGSDLIGGETGISFLPEEAVVGEAPDLALSEVEGEPHLLAIWADSRVVARQDVYAQLLSLDGTPVGPEIAIDEIDNNAKSGVRLVSKGDGFLAVWATAEGVFAQQLNADGTKRGILFGLADPGAQSPRPAFGGEGTSEGGAWAVAWMEPGAAPGSQVKMRALSTDTESIRAPIQSLGGVTDTVSSVALVGHESGFLALWEGPAGAGRGLVAQDASRTGVPRGASFTVFEGVASAPAIAHDGEEFFVVFRAAGSFGYAASQSFTEFAEVADPKKAARLSAESISQNGFRVAPGGTGFFSLWDDGRHLSFAPAVQSVYGNQWGEAGVSWSFSRGFYAAPLAQLGGLATHEGSAYFLVKTGSTAALHVQALD